jgi:hypothetical protein
MLPPSRKSNVENKEYLTSATVLKIENVVSISTPFNNKVTEIDVHREEISYIVSEEFFEQFTALAFIDFKKTPQKIALLVESATKKPTLYEIKASFRRRRFAAKTRLASQVLKIKLALHDFRTKEVKSPLIMTTSIFSTMCSMTVRLKKEYFDSEETLSISFIIFARSILAMKTQHRFENILGRNSFVPEVPSFFYEDRSYGLFGIFFSTEECLQNANDNVVSYHEVSVIWKIKRRSENIAFPFLVKSLPVYREARRIISIIL